MYYYENATATVLSTESDQNEQQEKTSTVTPQQIAYFVIGSVGLVANLFVIVVILRSKSMRKVVTTTFILNQSLVDALVAISLITNYLPQNNNKRHFSRNAWDLFVCRVWLNKSILWSMFMVSSLNLVALTLERLIAVWKPLWHKSSFTRSKRVIMMVFIWTVGPIVVTGHNIVDSRVAENGRCFNYGEGGLAARGLGFVQVILEFVIPLLVFVISYSMIAWILRQQSIKMTQHQSAMMSSSSKKVHGGKSVIKTMAVVCFLFFVCWVSNEAYYIMYLSGIPVDFKSPFYLLSVNIVFVNCCCNPFVYIMKYKAFQKEVRKLVNCGIAIGPWSSETSGSVTGANG